MKVYACPAELPYNPDYRDFDMNRIGAVDAEHKASLKEWLVKAGYTGKRTGEILSIAHADGYANYMFADGSKSCLIHLPYGDGWDSPMASGLTKKAVIELIERKKKLDAFFASRGNAA